MPSELANALSWLVAARQKHPNHVVADPTTQMEDACIREQPLPDASLV